MLIDQASLVNRDEFSIQNVDEWNFYKIGLCIFVNRTDIDIDRYIYIYKYIYNVRNNKSRKDGKKSKRKRATIATQYKIEN